MRFSVSYASCSRNVGRTGEVGGTATLDVSALRVSKSMHRPTRGTARTCWLLCCVTAVYTIIITVLNTRGPCADGWKPHAPALCKRWRATARFSSARTESAWPGPSTVRYTWRHPRFISNASASRPCDM